MWTHFRDLFSRRKATPLAGGLPQDLRWILVPLGNPGDEYADTRHNLGRLLLQRWMDPHCRQPERVRAFSSGNLYALGERFLAMVPSTYMNLSGQVCAEAAETGLDPGRMILLHDDKDLPLGLGRFRLTGGAAGHNGLSSVFERLGTQAIPRLRLGIGPFQRPLHEFVLGDWTEEERTVIEALDAPFARFMGMLAHCEDLQALPSLVNAESFWMPARGRHFP